MQASNAAKCRRLSLCPLSSFSQDKKACTLKLFLYKMYFWQAVSPALETVVFAPTSPNSSVIHWFGLGFAHLVGPFFFPFKPDSLDNFGRKKLPTICW